MQAAKLSFLGSEEEPEMIFDWVDLERKGRLSLEEFSSGLSMSAPVGGAAGLAAGRHPCREPSTGPGWADGKATVTP